MSEKNFTKIGDILPSVLKSTGLAERLREREILSLWPAVVGREIAGRMSIRVIQARLWSAQGRSGDALDVLREALEEAATAGILGLEFELRLAAGEIELEAGFDDPGRARLELQNPSRPLSHP